LPDDDSEPGSELEAEPKTNAEPEGAADDSPARPSFIAVEARALDTIAPSPPVAHEGRPSVVAHVERSTPAPATIFAVLTDDPGLPDRMALSDSQIAAMATPPDDPELPDRWPSAAVVDCGTKLLVVPRVVAGNPGSSRPTPVVAYSADSAAFEVEPAADGMPSQMKAHSILMASSGFEGEFAVASPFDGTRTMWARLPRA
jgi:hypothetical protein